jgi:hypothetical protein
MVQEDVRVPEQPSVRAVAVLALRAGPGLLRFLLVVWGFHAPRTTSQSLAHAEMAEKVRILVISASLCGLCGLCAAMPLVVALCEASLQAWIADAAVLLRLIILAL